MSAEKWLIVGIDLGTTAFTIAYRMVHRITDKKGIIINTPISNIEVINKFPNQVERGVTAAPTDLYYSTTNEVHWGHTAIDDEESENFDPSRSIHNWKLCLHHSTDPTHQHARQKLKVAALNLGKYNASEFLSDFICEIYKFLFLNDGARFKRHCGESLADSNVEIVVATPPGWTRSEHMEILEAAKQLGFSSRQIFLASETECLFRQWVYEYRRNGHDIPLGENETVLVVDAGGGTTCIVIFKKTGKGMIQMFPSRSLNAGSELVTEEFLKVLTDRLDRVKRIADVDRICRTARKLFDTRKKKMDGPAGSRVLDIPVPGLSESHAKWAGDGIAFFTPAQVERCFNPSLTLIRDAIKELLSQVSDTEKPKLVLLGGAYGSSNSLLKKTVMQAVGDETIGPPHDPEAGSESVARGAVLTRMQDNFIGKRCSKFSIGIITFIEYQKVVKEYPHLRNKVFRAQVDEGGEEQCFVCTWAIRKGEIVASEQKFKVDSKSSRWRPFDEDVEIEFEDTIIVSSEDPGDVEYTVLEHGNFSDNIAQASARGEDWQILKTSWNLGMAQKPKSAVLAIQNETTLRWQYWVDYRYFVYVSDTEIRFRAEFQWKNPHGTSISDVKQCPFERGGAIRESTFIVQERKIQNGETPTPVRMGEELLETNKVLSDIDKDGQVPSDIDEESKRIDSYSRSVMITANLKAGPKRKKKLAPDSDDDYTETSPKNKAPRFLEKALRGGKRPAFQARSSSRKLGGARERV